MAIVLMLKMYISNSNSHFEFYLKKLSLKLLTLTILESLIDIVQ